MPWQRGPYLPRGTTNRAMFYKGYSALTIIDIRRAVRGRRHGRNQLLHGSTLRTPLQRCTDIALLQIKEEKARHLFCFAAKLSVNGLKASVGAGVGATHRGGAGVGGTHYGGARVGGTHSGPYTSRLH